MALDNARRHAGTPKSDFLYNLVFTCEKVSKELQPADRSEDFGEWELFMNEQANVSAGCDVSSFLSLSQLSANS